LKKHELLRDISSIGLLWAAVLGVVFILPDVAVSTKYQLAILATIGTIIGALVYFGWERLYERRSFVKPTVFGILAIGLLLYYAYLIDALAISTWVWISFNGVLVVTWANLFSIVLLLMSVILYNLCYRIIISIVNETRQIRQEEVEKTAIRAAEQLIKLIELKKQGESSKE
jgi:hypothetical protein